MNVHSLSNRAVFLELTSGSSPAQRALDARRYPSHSCRVNAPSRHELSAATKVLAALPASARYLIGVSGGRDSIALLHLLQSVGYQKLIVCHLDHQLRGRNARADARFVQKIARAADLDCEIGKTDVKVLARESKASIETAARIARFAFFVSVARRRRCRTIFLAHHADDLVETALLNLFRGASPGGIAAMREISMHRVGKLDLIVVRPLLGVWRREIDAYIKEHALSFREDETNRSLSARRNQVRHQILPYVEKRLGREVRKSIWRTAKIWSEEDALLDSMTGTAMASERCLDVRALREMPVALQRRIIFSWMRQRGISNLGFDLVENVRGLIATGAHVATANLPRDYLVRRQKNKLFITSARDKR
jgi:tRNA(Ile)-lysidine synthase